MTPSGKVGVTVVEMMVATVIFGILVGSMNIWFHWNRSAMDTMVKTDLTARLRNSSIVIGRLLSFSTEFLYPCNPSSEQVNQIVFRDRNNQISGLFLDKNQVLNHHNYSTGETVAITPFTVGFKARLVEPNLLEYQIEIKKGEFEFFIQNQQSTCNTLP